MPTDLVTEGLVDPRSELVAQVHQRTRAVIEAELQWLARRAPTLHRTELEIVEIAFSDLAESLVLARLRSAGTDAVPLLSRLFDTRSYAR